MVPGKLIHRLFPSIQVTTHCTVNRLARGVLFVTPVHKFLPSARDINYYEGMQGIDGLWMRDQHLPSRSVYNPLTQQGNGLIEVREQFQALLQVCKEDSPELPKHLAYLSHIISDLCTPPHQYGQLIKPKRERWYWFYTTSDWTDQEPGQWFNQHILFEMNLMVRFLFKPFKQAKVYTQLVNEYMRYRHKRSEVLLKFMREQITTIHKLGIYQEYLRYGWTKHIEQTMRLVVLPNIVSLVATSWYLAAKEGKQLQKQHFAISV